MASINIIESSCKANNRVSNSEWETILPKPIIINNGDMINIKNAFINQESLQSTNILIPEDITLVFQFAFYVINGLQFCQYNDLNKMLYYYLPSFSTPQSNPAGPGFPTEINMVDETQVPIYSDFRPYVLHLDNGLGNHGFQLVEKRHEILLKAGNYTPLQLSTYISKRLSSVNGKNLQGDTEGIVDDVLQVNSGSPFLINCTTGEFENIAYWLDSYNANAPNLNDVYKFRLIAQEQTGNAPEAPAGDLFLSYMVGTNQLSLDYDDISQTFRFSFIHMPTTNPNSGDISNLLCRSSFIYQPNNKQYIGPLHTQTKQGGIFFTKLEPVSFWETLGFNINNLVVQNINQGIDTEEILNKTTDNQLGLSTIMALSPNNTQVIDQGNYQSGEPTYLCKYLSNNNVIPLIGASSYQSSNSGYYLIETDLGFIQEYSTEEKIYSCISAIGSKQWIQSDFVTIFSDSAIPYIHNGSPFMLSSIKIRILDRDKNIVKGLRPNSSVFLQVIKNEQSKEENIKQQKTVSNPANK